MRTRAETGTATPESVRQTAPAKAWGAGSGSGRAAKLKQRLPTFSYLESAARRRIPGFAFDFVDGATGEHLAAERNRSALDAVQIIPQYGAGAAVSTEVELFGRFYASPFGIAPVGVDGLVWPGATQLLAKAAQRARIPYITGTLASGSLEEVARLCPDSVWLQLYGLPRDRHRVTFDLIRRAEDCGVHAVVATLDAPVRAKRPRDLHNGLVVPFRMTPRTVWQVATSLPWIRALFLNGAPGFANMERYVSGGSGMAATAGFVQNEIKGTFDWDTLARMRDAWPRALVVKGVLHPDDAERAISLGIDGILVSNHGGRQSEAAPPSIDMLPSIVQVVGQRATVLFDSGIRSGLDVARALALGARGTFCGRAFLYGLAALGSEGPDHVAQLLDEELRTAMAQNGAHTCTDLRNAAVRHPAAWHL
jgi:L-lactate dehydrogenase (cytochrome)